MQNNYTKCLQNYKIQKCYIITYYFSLWAQNGIFNVKLQAFSWGMVHFMVLNLCVTPENRDCQYRHTCDELSETTKPDLSKIKNNLYI